MINEIIIITKELSLKNNFDIILNEDQYFLASDDVDYLVIGVRKIYRQSKDFDKVTSFFETMYVSNRIGLPLKGILVIGY